jgi:hypothetical protein
MICAYGGGELIQFVFSPEPGERALARARARSYFLCAAACAVASLINPYTYQLHVHMAEYLRNPWNSRHIQEFLSPSFHQPRAIFFEMLLGMGAATACFCLSKRRYTEALLIAIWAHAALLASRNIPIFVIVTAPIVAAAIQHALDASETANLAEWLRTLARRFSRITERIQEMESVPRWRLASVAGFLMMAAIFFAPKPPANFRAEFDPKRYPTAALNELQADATARIFTNDEWGDYLIWSLYPKQRVFVDGRSDFYGNDFADKSLAVLRVNYGWEKTLSSFGVNTILLPLDAPLTGALKESSRWRVVFDDGSTLVFRSNERAAGATLSAAAGDGKGRDREVTKTQTSDRPITATKTKT